MWRVTALILAAAVLLLAACGDSGVALNNNNGNASYCGNLQIDIGESCDRSNLDGRTCEDEGYSGGTLACGSDCRHFDVSDCEAPEDCGNGVVDLTEDCDDDNLGGQSCGGLGYPGGTLGCTALCDFDVSQCDPPLTCGNGTVDAPEVCDGTDLGTETCVTQGFDSGTLACATDCISFDTGGCSHFACGNGQQEVGEACDDGNTTGGDGCSADCLSDETCGNGIVDTVVSEECDDGNQANGDGCTAGCLIEDCPDGDGDGHTAYDAQDCPGGDDNCDADQWNWTSSGCTSCTDADGDGARGTGCDSDEDCDDTVPGIAVPCQANGCPAGWIHIPAGDFEMGCNAGELGGTCETNAEPRHTVTLSAYCVQETEVAVGAYRACLAAGLCTGTPTPTATRTFCNWSANAGARENHPINCITWFDSLEYCQVWEGGALPTEAQWEKSARGSSPDQRRFPWGDNPAPDCNHCNFDVNGSASGLGCSSVNSGPGTWEVGSLTSGAGDSPFGLKDMAGNVYEWVEDWYQSDYYSSCAGGCSDPLNTYATSGTRAIRGGSFYGGDPAYYLNVVYRFMFDPAAEFDSIGFRCRRTP